MCVCLPVAKCRNKPALTFQTATTKGISVEYTRPEHCHFVKRVEIELNSKTNTKF